MSAYRTRLLLVLAIFCYVTYVIFITVDQRENNFKDFEVYYNSTSADNPYDQQQIKTNGLVYQYLPLTKYVFVPFTQMDRDVALFVYLIINILVVVLMVRLWSRIYAFGADPWFYLFMILAVNASFYLAFRTGNLVIITTMIIWLGLDQLLKGKGVGFAIFILIASIFKITPIILLPLILIPSVRKGLKPSILVFVGFLLFVFLNWIIEPELFQDFLNAGAALLSETGIYNPNTYSLSQELGTYALKKFGLNEAGWPGTMVYIIFISILLYLTYRWWQNNKDRITRLELISVGLILYSLVLPRFKDYDYILILPCLYFMIRNIRVAPFYLLLTLALISATYVVIPGYRYGMYVLWNYYPVLIAATVYVLYLRTGFKSITVDNEA